MCEYQRIQIVLEMKKQLIYNQLSSFFFDLTRNDVLRILSHLTKGRMVAAATRKGGINKLTKISWRN